MNQIKLIFILNAILWAKGDIPLAIANFQELHPDIRLRDQENLFRTLKERYDAGLIVVEDRSKNKRKKKISDIEAKKAAKAFARGRRVGRDHIPYSTYKDVRDDCSPAMTIFSPLFP